MGAFFPSDDKFDSLFATKVTPQNLYGLQVGDALDKSGSHVVLVEDIGYDDDGDIVYIDIMEQTPPKTKETRYGIGGEKSLSDLYTRYIEEWRICDLPQQDKRFC